MSRKAKICYGIGAFAAVAIFWITTSAATKSVERLYRPDSAGYIVPAQALAEKFVYPTTLRPPGYPLLAATVFRCGGGEKTLAFAGMLIAIAACVITGITAKKYTGNPHAGMIAALLSGLNITVIANAPLLLSDTWFFLFAALQLFLFVCFWQNSRSRTIYTCALVAALGTLIRPINLLFILPLTTLIFCHPQLAAKKKLLTALGAIIIFMAVIMPWMYRNYLAGATFAIDTNTGAMRHQNGAMLMAEINNSDFESEKKRLLQEEAALTFPDARSKEQWRIAEFRKMVMQHPWTYLKQHCNWQILLPDAPSFLEDFGITSANRGTMGVLQKSGIFAAVKHYFGENYLLLLTALLPLLAVHILLYAGAAWKLLNDFINWKSHWREILIYLAFCEYYLFLPGAITAPRYQLPALPFLAVLAGGALCDLWQKITLFRNLKSKN